MSAFLYHDTPWPMGEKLPAHHQFAWRWLAAPNCWWSGAERVAIAEEVRHARHCDLCQRRKAALSALAIEGEHEHAGKLPAAAVEAAHRLATDSGRLTRDWYENLLDEQFTDGHYVEVLGIVVATISIDAVHESLGLPMEPLPVPEPGEPTRYRPPGAKMHGNAWVPTIDVKDATGLEADIYGGATRSANVIDAMSLVPDNVRMLSRLNDAHYINQVPNAATNEGRTLTRPQIELIAARVSALNDCFY